ncbi:MAG TPA: pyruvate kinase, partial [Alphaproteobacteria bacterium]|nr:pyruvate kinase [Alphaproteobacteria bacterium]
MRRNRQTKIVATLGPASSTREVIERLFRAGVDVFRLNFSHGSHADHRARLSTVRALEAETGRPVGVVADMQGPKLRIGKFADGKIPVKPGHVIRLDLD